MVDNLNEKVQLFLNWHFELTKVVVQTEHPHKT